MTQRQALTAIYPGTFDPMTLGHADLMRRASSLFDRLILAVAAGHHKRTLFSAEERLDMAREIAKVYPNIEVMPFSGLLRNVVVDNGGKVVLRGLRAVTDFEEDMQMARMKRQRRAEIQAGYTTRWDETRYGAM